MAAAVVVARRAAGKERIGGRGGGWERLGRMRRAGEEGGERRGRKGKARGEEEGGREGGREREGSGGRTDQVGGGVLGQGLEHVRVGQKLLECTLG